MEVYQRVRLTTNKYQEDGIYKGDIGTILEDYGDGNFEVDFSDNLGNTIAIFAFPENELEEMHAEN
jgi:hypothetical protein